MRLEDTREGLGKAGEGFEPTDTPQIEWDFIEPNPAILPAIVEEDTTEVYTPTTDEKRHDTIRFIELSSDGWEVPVKIVAIRTAHFVADLSGIVVVGCLVFLKHVVIGVAWFCRALILELFRVATKKPIKMSPTMSQPPPQITTGTTEVSVSVNVNVK